MNKDLATSFYEPVGERLARGLKCLICGYKTEKSFQEDLLQTDEMEKHLRLSHNNLQTLGEEVLTTGGRDD